MSIDLLVLNHATVDIRVNKPWIKDLVKSEGIIIKRVKESPICLKENHQDPDRKRQIERTVGKNKRKRIIGQFQRVRHPTLYELDSSVPFCIPLLFLLC